MSNKASRNWEKSDIVRKVDKDQKVCPGFLWASFRTWPGPG